MSSLPRLPRPLDLERVLNPDRTFLVREAGSTLLWVLKRCTAPAPVLERRLRRLTAVAYESGLCTERELLACDGATYSLRPYVEGQSLREVRGSLETARAVALVAETLSALGALHRRGIAFGRLHSGNAVVDARGSVRLVDLLEPGAWLPPAGHRTEVSAAPEQLRGSAPSVRSDVYSAGLLLSELLTGHHPFAGDEALECVRRALYEPPHLPTAGRIPAELLSLAARCLQKQPLRRPPRPERMAAALTPFLPSVAEAPPVAALGLATEERGERPDLAARAGLWAGAPRPSPPSPVRAPDRSPASAPLYMIAPDQGAASGGLELAARGSIAPSSASAPVYHPAPVQAGPAAGAAATRQSDETTLVASAAPEPSEAAPGAMLFEARGRLNEPATLQGSPAASLLDPVPRPPASAPRAPASLLRSVGVDESTSRRPAATTESTPPPRHPPRVLPTLEELSHRARAWLSETGALVTMLGLALYERARKRPRFMLGGALVLAGAAVLVFVGSQSLGARALEREVEALLEQKETRRAAELLRKEGGGEDTLVVSKLRADLACAQGRHDECLRLYRQVLERSNRYSADERIRANTLALLDREDRRWQVAAVAGRLKGIESELAEATRSERYWRRWNAVRALEQSGDTGEVDYAVVYGMDVLHAGSCSTRRAALAKLAELKDEAALPYLEKARARAQGKLFGDFCLGGDLARAIRLIKRAS